MLTSFVQGTPAGSDVEAAESATPPSKKQKQQESSPSSAKKVSDNTCTDAQYTRARVTRIFKCGNFVSIKAIFGHFSL